MIRTPLRSIRAERVLSARRPKSEWLPLPFHLEHASQQRAKNSLDQPCLGRATRSLDRRTDGSWLPAHRKADGANGPYFMGYYTRADIPFQFALAESFTLCDAYFCSVMGPTWPNRMYWMTGMIDPEGTGGGPIIRQRRAHGRIYVDHLRGAAGESRRELEGLPAGRQPRPQHAAEFQSLSRRSATRPSTRKRWFAVPRASSNTTR